MLKQFKNSGQAILLVLLVASVALGLGLSIISQSTTDMKLSQQEQESARAFNAAEAGIEQALKTISEGSGNLTVGGVDVDYQVSGESFIEGVFEENDSAQVILGDVNNTLTIEWVDEDSSLENPDNCGSVSAESGSTAASLLISIINDNYEIRRYGVNACSLSGDNGMEDVSNGGTGKYLRSYSVAITANDHLVRIRPIYNAASIKVSATTDLPTQSYLIDSSAQTETLEAKAIRVSRLQPAAPAIFDYVLFSGNSLQKLN